MPSDAAKHDWTDGPPKHAAAIALLVAALTCLGMALRDRAGGPRRAAALAAVVDARIDVNSAPTARLQLLPGIGPALAGRIVDDRARRGPFRSVDDLQRVKGIGPRTVARLRDIAVADPAGAR